MLRENTFIFSLLFVFLLFLVVVCDNVETGCSGSGSESHDGFDGDNSSLSPFGWCCDYPCVVGYRGEFVQLFEPSSPPWRYNEVFFCFSASNQRRHVNFVLLDMFRAFKRSSI